MKNQSYWETAATEYEETGVLPAGNETFQTTVSMTAEAMKRERKMTPARVEKIARKIDSEVDGLTAIETDERGEKSEPKSAKDFFDTDQKQEILLRVIKLEEKPELDEITAERFIRQKFFEKMIHARTNQKADIELFDGDGGGITPSNYQTVAGEIF